RTRWLLAVGATVVFAFGGVGIGTVAAPGATDPGFKALEHNSHIALIHNGQVVTNPQAAPVPGDDFMISSDLIQYPHVVGYDEIRCHVQFNNNLLCIGTYKFNAGQISAQALLDSDTPPPAFDVAIVGGTGAWDTARGVITLAGLDDTDSLLTFDID